MRKEITQADIAEYLVTQSDFDLELFVDRSLQERGITTSHGGSYFDSVTGKSRQYDVRAYAYIPYPASLRHLFLHRMQESVQDLSTSCIARTSPGR
jgi:hypothetical protein